MAITNHERVGKAIELLKAGLGPFAEREFASAYQAKAQSQAALFLGEDRLLANKPVTQMGRGSAPQTHVGCVERCLS